MWRYMTGWESEDHRCGVCGDYQSHCANFGHKGLIRRRWQGLGCGLAPFSDVRVLKVKLGSPAGISADQAMLMAVRRPAPTLYVDANGLEFEEAIAMCNWLASGVKYVEQPAARGGKKSTGT